MRRSNRHKIRKTWDAQMAGVLLAVAGALVLLHVERLFQGGVHGGMSTRTLGTFLLLLQSSSYSVFMVC